MAATPAAFSALSSQWLYEKSAPVFVSPRPTTSRSARRTTRKGRLDEFFLETFESRRAHRCLSHIHVQKQRAATIAFDLEALVMPAKISKKSARKSRKNQ